MWICAEREASALVRVRDRSDEVSGYIGWGIRRPGPGYRGGVRSATPVTPVEQIIEVDGLTIAVRSVGLACCAVEVSEAQSAWSTRVVPQGEPDAHVLVVAGTVSVGLVESLLRMWQKVPQPRAVVAYGACTISGGPYWDSYIVRRGLPETLTPVVQVPGCPPRPDVLTGAVKQAAELAVKAG